MSREGAMKRLKELKCSEEQKKKLGEHLFSCLAEGKSFKLKRNRVMIMDPGAKNKFIILDLVTTIDEEKQIYVCPKCSNLDYSNFLTASVSYDQFKSCIHSELCHVIWGDLAVNVDVMDDEEGDLVEVVTEKPRYLAVVHLSKYSLKGPGAVTVTSRTLKPKCLVCRGQDCCAHLRIHMTHYKRTLEADEMEENVTKKLRVEKIESERPVKKQNVVPGTLDPFEHEGSAVNVFNIEIDFIQTQENMLRNREVFEDKKAFAKKDLVPKYDKNEVCKHGYKYIEEVSILCVESTQITIHHTRHIESSDRKVFYRPTAQQSDRESCHCKKWYTGEDDLLIRVSSACEKVTRHKPLHFVSIEYCFSFLSELVTSGETMHGFIKSKKFLNEIFLGIKEKNACQKYIYKGFEIFCHALKFPENSNTIVHKSWWKVKMKINLIQK